MAIVLILRQLLLGLKRDRRSMLALPPRMLFGNGAVPIFGHTFLLTRLGIDDAFKTFQTDTTKNCLPRDIQYHSRMWECFAIFVWTQWRLFIYGPRRSKAIFSQAQLAQSSCVSKELVGRTCSSFPIKDKYILLQLLKKPLSHESVIQMAPMFASVAEIFVDRILKTDNSTSKNSESVITPLSLREYTLHLIDGQILDLNLWNRNNIRIAPQKGKDSDIDKCGDNKKNDFCPMLLLLWIKRIHNGFLW